MQKCNYEAAVIILDRREPFTILSCHQKLYKEWILLPHSFPNLQMKPDAPMPAFSSRLPLLVGLDIDNSLCPLASRNLALEQNVDFAVGSVLHLRQEEVCHDETKETCASPDVAALATEVCLLHYVSNFSP